MRASRPSGSWSPWPNRVAFLLLCAWFVDRWYGELVAPAVAWADVQFAAWVAWMIAEPLHVVTGTLVFMAGGFVALQLKEISGSLAEIARRKREGE